MRTSVLLFFFPAAMMHEFLLLQVQGAGLDWSTVFAIAFYAAFTVVVPLALGLLGYGKLSPALKYFVYLLAFTLFTEVTGLVLSRIELKNLWLYNTYTAVEYTLLIMMFTSLLEGNRLRRILLWSIPVFVVIWGLASFLLTVSDKFHSIFLSIESVVFVFLAVMTLVKEMRDSSVLLVDNPVFWVASGVLVYFAGNLLVFTFIDQLLEDKEVGMLSAWVIHAAMNVSKNIMYSIGFLSTGGPQHGVRSIVRFIRGKGGTETSPVEIP